jgi:hypothetical protein
MGVGVNEEKFHLCCFPLRCVAKVMDKLEIVVAIPPRVTESNFLVHLSTYIPMIIMITQH